MESKFSPGPWTVTDHLGHVAVRVENGILPHKHRAPGGWAVAIFPNPGNDVMTEREGAGLDHSMSEYSKAVHAQAKANAQLASCAPDLLEALEKLKNEAEGFVNAADPSNHGHTNIEVMRHWINNAETVISKAKAAPNV